jgi:heme oxygenase (staphylobilin-producing)
MHVAINRLRVPAEYADHLEQAFQRASNMAGVPGFRSFKLLRNENGGEYLVLTEWDDRAAFETWTQSDAFSRAHSGSNPDSPVKSELAVYEAIVEREAEAASEPPTAGTGITES